MTATWVGRLLAVSLVSLIVSVAQLVTAGPAIGSVTATACSLVAVTVAGARPVPPHGVRRWRYGLVTRRLWRWRARFDVRVSTHMLVGVARFRDVDDGDTHYQISAGPLVVTALVWRVFTRREMAQQTAAYQAWAAVQDPRSD